MIYVLKEDSRYPFSKGILATSLNITGLSIDKRYEIVQEVNEDLKEGDKTEVRSKEIKELVRKKLLNRGYEKEEKFYRISREIRYLDKPLLVLIGGGPGVGKSTLSAELGHRLGINRVIGTDTIREIMRTMLTYDIFPNIHESTYMTDKSVSAPFVSNRLIYGFDQQVSLVNVGIEAVIDRGIEEGLNTIISGVHIVPGYIDFADNENAWVFQYVLEVPNLDEHVERFKMRAEGSHRDPDRYIGRMDEIREIQDYTIQQARKNDVRVITNINMEPTIRRIIEDIIIGLEQVVEDE